jgi:hypothetical protein
MGTYTDLCVAGYPLWNTSASVDSAVMTVFRESDKRVFERKVSERNSLVWGEPNEADRNNTETAVVYTCRVAHAVDRLNVMGFTLSRVRGEFESGRASELQRFESWSAERGQSDWFTSDWEFMKALRFDDYADALRTVVSRRLLPWAVDELDPTTITPLMKFILRKDEDRPLGFLGFDARLLVRLACELVDETGDVVQDITELVQNGYYRQDEAVCEEAVRSLTADYPQNSSRIILTEGATDREILADGLSILYPHLSGYYSFMDFDSSRSQGGAGHLVSIVKAFSGAGITNRIIAVFDNDTAAFEARRAFARVALPKNIAVLNYPDLESLRAYPTLGPSGQSLLDINGLAASIEMYLGDDVLRVGGALPPVQWRGFSEILGKYQGEVMGKERIRDAFKEKVARCRRDPDEIPRYDWNGLRAVLGSIFNAFE